MKILIQDSDSCTVTIIIDNELTKYPTRGEKRTTQNGDELIIMPVTVEEQPLEAAYLFVKNNNDITHNYTCTEIK